MPIVSGDHGALKTILLGVWRVAAGSLAGEFCCGGQQRRRMIGPGGDTSCTSYDSQTRKPNWGHPIAPAPALATEFELRVKQLHLTPEMYTAPKRSAHHGIVAVHFWLAIVVGVAQLLFLVFTSSSRADLPRATFVNVWQSVRPWIRLAVFLKARQRLPSPDQL